MIDNVITIEEFADMTQEVMEKLQGYAGDTSLYFTDRDSVVRDKEGKPHFQIAIFTKSGKVMPL
jgi:hypothetical protein